MKHIISRLIKKYSTTVGDETEIDEMTAAALVFQRAFGQQVLDPNWTWKRYSVHQTLNVLLFIYVFFGTLKCLNTTDDSELIAQACYTLIMVVIFPLKMLLFICNRSIFRELYFTAKTTLFVGIKADRSADMGKVLRRGNKIVYTLFSMVLVPCSIYELTTFWNYVNGRRILLSPSTLTLMPMSSPYYEVAWFLHTVFLFEISSTIILDMWFVLLIYFLCAASDSLARILNVEERDGNESELAYAARLNEGLKKFYAIHVEQVEFLNLLSRMYKWLSFVPLCNAAMCTCLLLLLMSKDLNWRFAPHMLPMFAEIFAYNWFGEQIKTKATNLYMALLNFDWTNMKWEDKKNYYIIIAYMQKSFGIKTAVGTDLSLITMSALFFYLKRLSATLFRTNKWKLIISIFNLCSFQVLKVSYQVFTVLQTMDN